MTSSILSTETGSQLERLLDWLELIGSITTAQAREKLDIQSPAPRILELKKLGYDIRTEKTNWRSPLGVMHKIAKYVLVKSED